MLTDTSLQTIQTLYIAYYGRPADPQGLQFWAERLDEAEGNLEAILDDFGTSEEYTETFGELDDATLVNNLYQQLFGRDAEQEGLDGYVASLESGELTLAEIAAEIAGGAQNEDAEALEAKREAADRFTESLAERPAGQQAYQGGDSAQAARDYLAGVTNGEQAESADPEAVVEDLVATASQAYIDEIQKLYVAYYGRPADPDGLAFWTEQALANGGDLASLVEAFGNSDEYSQGLAQLDPEEQVEALYQQLFGREADEEGLALYSEALANGELTLAEIALVIADGAAEEDQAVVDARVKVAKAVTDSLDSEEAIEEFSSEEGQQAAKELVGGVQSDEQADEIIEAIESGGEEDEGEDGGGSGVLPSFTVSEASDGTVTFGGNTSGAISFTVSNDDTATFERDGITASTTVEDIETKTLSLGDGQVLEITADQLDGQAVEVNGGELDVQVAAGEVLVLSQGSDSVWSVESYDSIQAAVDGADEGDSLLVGDGTYTEDVEITTANLSVEMSDGAVLEGGFFVDAGGDGFSLQGGTIQDGLQDPSNGNAQFKGIYVKGEADISVQDTIFDGAQDDDQQRGIEAESGGGSVITVDGASFNGWVTGIYLNAGHELVLTNSSFDGNTASVGTDGPERIEATGNTFLDNGEAFGFSPEKTVAELAILDNVFTNTPAFNLDLGVEEIEGTFIAAGGSIQDAIDAAEAGDTLYLGPGEFDGGFTIDKPLTLRGAVDDQGEPTSSIIGSGNLVTIDGDFPDEDVTLENLEIKGGTKGVAVASGTDMGTLNVTNSIIANNGDYGLMINDGDYGPDAPSTVDLAIQDSLFSENGAYEAGANGANIKLWRFDGDLDIAGSTIAGAGPFDNYPAAYGIEIQGADNQNLDQDWPLGNVTISGLTVEGVFAKNPVAIFNYEDIEGLDIQSIDLSGATSGWKLFNIDGIGSQAVDASGINLVMPVDGYTEIQGEKTREGDGQVVTDSTIIGTEYNDEIKGKGGDNTLTGNGGEDIFILSGEGDDEILDFAQGEDVFRFVDKSITFDDLVVTVDGSDTVITANNSKFDGSVTLAGVTGITEDDFWIS